MIYGIINELNWTNYTIELSLGLAVMVLDLDIVAKK